MAEAEAAQSRIQAFFAALGPWPRRGVALLGGALATLGHAPFQIVPAYIAAITVLVLLLDVAAKKKKRLWSGAITGYCFGLGHFSTGLYWISSAFLVDPESWGAIWGVSAAIGLAAGLAFFWAFGCALAMLLWTSDMRRIPAFAIAVFISEWLRGNILSGFPWLLPGYIWTPGEPVSQFASVVGIYGLSVVTLLIAAAPAVIGDGQARAGRRFAPLVAAGLVLGLLWGWGTHRISTAPIALAGSRPIVRVADSGLSQAEKWRRRSDQEMRVLDRYLEVSGSPEDSDAQIVIWPEGAIPVVNFFTLENPEFMAAIGAGMGDRVLITGLSRRELREDGKVHFFNSAAVIDGVSGQPRLSQVYDKNHLVPFGEYLPPPVKALADMFQIRSLQQMGEAFTPGPPPTRLVVPDADPAVVLICYEAIFPGMTPRGVERPGWIISVTNDAWFGDGTGPWQHFAMARYRAIEEGLPLARAASGGVSAIVDAYGRTAGRTVSSTSRRGGFVEAQLPPSIVEGTPLSNLGYILLPALLVFVLALRFVPARRGLLQ